MTTERTLHHFTLDPASRQVRLVLQEKRLAYSEVIERYWERPKSLSDLNPSGIPPVLVEQDGGERLVLCETHAILEYLEERYPQVRLLAEDIAERAEARRLTQWFGRQFDGEVNGFLLREKMEKRLTGGGSPDHGAMRAGREALRRHLRIMEDLIGVRGWLAGKDLSVADFAAAAHLSVIDYFGDVPWRDFPITKTWYMRLKSRPSFRPILADRWPGMIPAADYDNLDF
jgi:glutathione S-transferase